jgi:transposase
VSDRWHLVKNLAGCVSVQLTESLGKLRRAQQAETPTLEERQRSHEQQSHSRTRAVKHTQQVRQAERIARYEQIMALHSQGMKGAAIAMETGMAERTVRH